MVSFPAPAWAALTIEPASLPNGVIDEPYSVQFTTAEGATATTYSQTPLSGTETGLPPGIAILANGELSGTPTQTGVFTFSITVLGSVGGVVDVGRQPFTLTIEEPADDGDDDGDDDGSAGIDDRVVTEVYRQARRFARAQTSNIAARLQAARAGRCSALGGSVEVLDSSGSAAVIATSELADPLEPAPSCANFDWVIWAEGTVAIGERDRVSSSPAVDFTTGGVTVGIDRLLRKDLLAGVAVGFGLDDADIGNDGTSSDGHSLSIAAYGSYMPHENLFFDAIGGVGLLDYDTRRFLPTAGGFAVDERGGSQLFGSLGSGYRHLAPRGWNAEAFVRLEGSVIMLDRSTETGGGASNATYFAETAYGLDGVIGLTASYPMDTALGVLTPRASVEYRHAFANSFDQTVSFAGRPGTRQVDGDLGPGDSIAFGLGADLELREDFLLGLDYRGGFGAQGFEQHGVQGRLAIRF